MDVYLVPASPDRYELHCEEASALPAGDTSHSTSLWGRAVSIFRAAIAEGEAERRRPADSDPSHGRIRRAITRRLAEAVAEQRLLWHLRREQSCRLVHPD